MTTVETLRAARQLITNPAHFHQGGQYTNTDGTAYCALGACMKAAGWPAASETPVLPAEVALDRALGSFWEGKVPSFNDAVSHADVLALFDRAIAFEEAREREMAESVMEAVA